MENFANGNRSVKNLHNFLQKRSIQLEQIGREKKQAEKEATSKKKRLHEKSMLIDSVVNRQTEGIHKGESSNLNKGVLRRNGFSKEITITLRNNGNEEKDAVSDFLEKKSSIRKQIIQKTIHPQTTINNIHALKNQQTEDSFKETKKVQSEKREKQKQWIKHLIKNTMAEQRLWTKGVINGFKKEQAERKNKQNEWIKRVIKNSAEKEKKSLNCLKKEKERQFIKE